MTVRRHYPAAALLLAAGCGGDPSPDPFEGPVPAQCPASTTQQAMVITNLELLRQSPMGVSPGFDLDSRVSDASDARSCHHRDLTAPDGTQGVDNQLSLLVPALETATSGALAAAIQAAINNGQLMLSVTIEGVDSRRDDPCVTLAFRRVSGTPFVGSDMRIDPGQTFETMHEEPVSRVTARLRNGVIEAGPFPLALPLAVLDTHFTIPLENARIRIRWKDDDTFEGVIGGGINAQMMIATTQTFNIPSSLMGLVRTLVLSITDLDPDANGVCQYFSAAVGFQARQAFVNP